MKAINPCLWFDTQAEEAADFYVSVFPRSRKKAVTHYSDNMPMPTGTVLTVTFELAGQPFMALNAGPQFKHSPAVSFMVNCADQAEIDRYWEKLSEGGELVECGWLTDRFGVSWQVVPAELEEMMSAGDPVKMARLMQAVMTMKKLDLAALRKAYRG